MSKIAVELTENDLRKMVQMYLMDIIGADIAAKDIHIQVKSKQNYKSEWEEAAFRAMVNKILPEPER